MSPWPVWLISRKMAWWLAHMIPMVMNVVA